MKLSHAFKLIGGMAALVVVAWGLLALNLVAQPGRTGVEAQTRLSIAPVAAVVPQEGTPEPISPAALPASAAQSGTCAAPLPIACGQQVQGDTRSYTNNHDDYGCMLWDESGREVIYSFTLAAGSFYTLTATLSNLGGVDLDLFVLSSGGCDIGECLQPFDFFNGDTYEASNVAPGTYYIAVDGYQGVEGTYTLELTCSNQPPRSPSAPSPQDGATGVDLEANLAWAGGDPDVGDTLVYTVYGQLFNSVISDVWCVTSGLKSFCKPSVDLQSNTRYLWQVDVADQHRVVRQGPFWEFTTESRIYVPAILKVWQNPAPLPPGITPTPTATQTSTPTPTPTKPPTPISPPASQSVTRFVNTTPYVIVSLKIDGVELYPARPSGLLPDHYVDLDLGVGTHTLDAYNGWWQDDGSRFTMYWWYTQFPQQAGTMTEIIFEGPQIELLLPNFGASRYWRGEYWTGFPVTLHDAAFCFYNNGKLRFYLDGQQDDTGTYSELYRTPGLVTFRVTNGVISFDGIFDELDGSFMMANGPADWQNIQYIPDDTVNCPVAP